MAHPGRQTGKTARFADKSAGLKLAIFSQRLSSAPERAKFHRCPGILLRQLWLREFCAGLPVAYASQRYCGGDRLPAG